MYNRYIPQPDGSYQRSRMPEPHPPVTRPPENRKPPAPEVCQPETEPPHGRQNPPCPGHRPPPRPPRNRPIQHRAPEAVPPGIGNFFRQLLPKDFDTEDLLIVLLLLLMSGENQEDQNTALLTLALYLFL